MNIFRVGSIIRGTTSGVAIFGGQLSWGAIVRGAIIRGAIILGDNYPGGNCPGGNCLGSIIRGAIALFPYLLLSMSYHGNMLIDKESSNFSIKDHKENYKFVCLFRYFTFSVNAS